MEKRVIRNVMVYLVLALAIFLGYPMEHLLDVYLTVVLLLLVAYLIFLFPWYKLDVKKDV